MLINIVHRLFVCSKIILRFLKGVLLDFYFNKIFLNWFLAFFFFLNVVVGVVVVSEEFLVGCSLLVFFGAVFRFVSVFIVEQLESYSKVIRVKFTDLAYLNLSKLIILRRYYIVDIHNWALLFRFLNKKLNSKLGEAVSSLYLNSHRHFCGYISFGLDRCVYLYLVMSMSALRAKFFLFSYNIKVRFYLNMAAQTVSRKKVDINSLIRLYATEK